MGRYTNVFSAQATALRTYVRDHKKKKSIGDSTSVAVSSQKMYVVNDVPLKRGPGRPRKHPIGSTFSSRRAQSVAYAPQNVHRLQRSPSPDLSLRRRFKSVTVLSNQLDRIVHVVDDDEIDSGTADVSDITASDVGDIDSGSTGGESIDLWEVERVLVVHGTFPNRLFTVRWKSTRGRKWPDSILPESDVSASVKYLYDLSILDTMLGKHIVFPKTCASSSILQGLPDKFLDKVSDSKHAANMWYIHMLHTKLDGQKRKLGARDHLVHLDGPNMFTTRLLNMYGLADCPKSVPNYGLEVVEYMQRVLAVTRQSHANVQLYHLSFNGWCRQQLPLLEPYSVMGVFPDYCDAWNNDKENDMKLLFENRRLAHESVLMLEVSYRNHKKTEYAHQSSDDMFATIQSHALKNGYILVRERNYAYTGMIVVGMRVLRKCCLYESP